MRQIDRTGLLACFLALFVNACPTEATASDNFDTKSVLDAAFRGDLETAMRADVLRVAYCPDNTCDVFEMKNEGRQSTLYDFAYLYFYYLTSYNYSAMVEFRKEQRIQDVERVLTRNAGDCRKKNVIIRCVMLSLQKNFNVTVKFVRFDENKRSETIEDLAEVLRLRKY